MLSRKEKLIMKAVYSKAVKTEGKCLMTPTELLTDISFKEDFRREDLEPCLKTLVLEDYFELIDTEKKGERVFCFTLHQNGYAFASQIESEKRAIKFKIVLTVAGAILSVTLVRVLTLLFG